MSDQEEVRALHEPVWTLGDRLAKSRRDAGLKQEDMAREFGVDASAISQWENDKSKPRDLLSVSARWAEITSVRVQWLMWGTSQSACWGVVDPMLGQGDLFDAALPPPELEVIVSSSAG